MNRVISAIIFILLLPGMLVSASFIQPANAEFSTIYIRADGSIDPPQAPISTVDKVTYTLTDNIVINLTGQAAHAIVVERNNTVIDGNGYTLQGLNYSASFGVKLSGRTNVTIRNTHIENFGWGIMLDSSSGNHISGNNIANNGGGIGVWELSSNNGISGNNITNGGGIHIWYSSYNSISGNTITARARERYATFGIIIDSSNYNSVTRNNITNSYDGIALTDSNYNSISENTMIENDWAGIKLYSSIDNILNGNTFTGCGLYFPTYKRTLYTNSVENNTVNGKPLVYLENVTGHRVDEAGQVILVNCGSIRIENLSLTNTTVGVQLLNTNNTLISRNNITANRPYGISLSYSNTNIISGNDLTNNTEGIELIESISNGINGNNITANDQHGIKLSYSSNLNDIGENTIAGNRYGIEITHFANYSTVRGNNITANDECGIWLKCLASNTTVSGNNITSNREGIHLSDCSNNNSVCGNNIADNECGIYIDSCADNVIHHNNFGNTQQVNVTSSNYIYYGNLWDDGYPSGGNYWSDYNGTDADLDGIGDTPYVIDGNNTDYYPLMKAYARPAVDINRDGKVDMKDVGFVARRFMCFPSDPLWDAVADLNGNQKIDMVDIDIVVKHFGEQYP